MAPKPQVQIEEVNGRTRLTFNKTKVRGKTTPNEVMDLVLVASALQAEAYIRKMTSGGELSTFEVNALAKLAEISKTQVPQVQINQNLIDVTPPKELDSIKNSLYHALRGTTVIEQPIEGELNGN